MEKTQVTAAAAAIINYLNSQVRTGKLAFFFNADGSAFLAPGSNLKSQVRVQQELLSQALSAFHGNVHQAELDAEVKAKKAVEDKAKAEAAETKPEGKKQLKSK